MTQAAPIPIAVPTVEPDVFKEPPPKPASPPPELDETAESSSTNFAELIPVTRLLISKKLHVRSVITFRGARNRYTVKTEEGTHLYTVEEENRWFAGYLAFGLRPFQLRVMNGSGEEVLRIRRPFACTARCLPCHLQSVSVFTSPDEFLGSVEQVWSPLLPIYAVKNAEGQDLFRITGPRFSMSLFKDVIFEIQKLDGGSVVGATCKRWLGLKHALFRAPIVDFFGVAFEQDLDVQHKLLLFAATMLIEYMYY